MGTFGEGIDMSRRSKFGDLQEHGGVIRVKRGFVSKDFKALAIYPLI